MSQFIQAILNTPPAIWIAIAAFAVSTAAFVLSYRRHSFDTRLAGAKKLTELRSVAFEAQRMCDEFLRALEKLEKIFLESRVSAEESLAAYREIPRALCKADVSMAADKIELDLQGCIVQLDKVLQSAKASRDNAIGARQLAGKLLKVLDFPPTQETAIRLERITADCENLRGLFSIIVASTTNAEGLTASGIALRKAISSAAVTRHQFAEHVQRLRTSSYPPSTAHAQTAPDSVHMPTSCPDNPNQF